MHPIHESQSSLDCQLVDIVGLASFNICAPSSNDLLLLVICNPGLIVSIILSLPYTCVSSLARWCWWAALYTSGMGQNGSVCFKEHDA